MPSNIKPKLSIIIPAYNVEKYISQCLDSVVGQSFADFEVLLIDDGSTDSTGRICDEYAAKDSRIRVVHQANGGQGAARNAGLAMAEADVVGFVDGDDWVEPSMFETLYGNMQRYGADISVCGMFINYADHQNTFSIKGGEKVMGQQEALAAILEDAEVRSYLWNKIFKKSLIGEKPFKNRTFEDHATAYKWFARCNRVVVCPKPEYHYRQRLSSTVYGNNTDKSMMKCGIEKERMEFAKQHLRDKSVVDSLVLRFVRSCILHAKDIAKYEKDKARAVACIKSINGMVKSCTGLPLGMLTAKQKLRVWLMAHSAPLFITYCKVDAFFAFGAKKRRKKCYD